MNSEFVYINEVGPRDGLQNQKTILSSGIRLDLINHLIDAKIPVSYTHLTLPTTPYV